MPGALPYRRLASFYFFNYAALGALVPYWSLYMDERGFNAVQTGQVMAIILAGRVIAPTLWGWLADRRGSPSLTMVIAAALSLAAFAAVPLTTTFAGLAAVMALFSVGFSGVTPQFEANTLNHLGRQPERYGHVRWWGSLGFIVAVTGGGLIFDRWQLIHLPALVSALLACMLLAVWVTPSGAAIVADGERASLASVLLRPQVLAFLLVCFLVQASFGPYYVFFSVFLAELGYSSGAIGAMWGLAVASEILVFIFASQLFRRFSMSALFQVATGLCVLRWLATGALADRPWILVIAQLTHMATFGLYHAVAVSLVHRYFKGALQVRGQGLYSSLSFGAGGVAGSLLSGYAWQHIGPAMTYYLASAIAAAAFLIALTVLRGIVMTQPGRTI